MFSYSFYPDGGLYEFHWQPRNGDQGQFEKFDRNGKLAGVKGSRGCFWNGAEVSGTQFDALSRNLERSGGSTSRAPVQQSGSPNAASPHR